MKDLRHPKPTHRARDPEGHRYETSLCNHRDTVTADLTTSGTPLPFLGISIQAITDDLGEDAFQMLAANSTVPVNVDPSHTDNLSEGGDFKFSATAMFFTAEMDSTALSKRSTTKSNYITSNVNGSLASAARKSFLSGDEGCMHSQFVRARELHRRQCGKGRARPQPLPFSRLNSPQCRPTMRPHLTRQVPRVLQDRLLRGAGTGR